MSVSFEGVFDHLRKPVDSVDDLPLEDVVDEFARLTGKIKEHAEKIKPEAARCAQLKKRLEKHIDETNKPTEKGLVEGRRHRVEFGIKAIKVESVDRNFVREVLGQDVFNDVATVGIGDIRRYLNPKQILKALKERRTGARKLSILG